MHFHWRWRRSWWNAIVGSLCPKYFKPVRVLTGLGMSLMARLLRSGSSNARMVREPLLDLSGRMFNTDPARRSTASATCHTSSRLSWSQHARRFRTRRHQGRKAYHQAGGLSNNQTRTRRGICETLVGVPERSWWGGAGEDREARRLGHFMRPWTLVSKKMERRTIRSRSKIKFVVRGLEWWRRALGGAMRTTFWSGRSELWWGCNERVFWKVRSGHSSRRWSRDGKL